MKNIKILSLLTLLAFGQIHGVSAPDVKFILAYQVIDEFNKTVSSDNDDANALNYLNTMNTCIAFDVTQQQALNAAKGGILYNGTPLDPVAIAKASDDLQKTIDTLNNNIATQKQQDADYQKTIDASNSNIHKLEKHKGNKKRIDSNQASRNEAQAKLDANNAAIAANQASITAAQATLNANKQAVNDNTTSMTTAQAAQATIATLRAKNALALEQAIESYIASLGQCYVKPGTSTVVISSKYNQNLPITPKEFNQLITTLNNAYAQFGSNVQITLDLQGSAPVAINNVVSAINNMPLSSSSYTSWALFGLKAAAVTAAAITAGAIAYNVSQGAAWNDTTAAQGVVNSAQAMTQTQLDNAYQAYQQNLAPGVTAMSEAAWANAQGLYSGVSQASQSATDWYNQMMNSSNQPA